MTTLYHAPMSRSSSVLALIEELGADIDVQTVSIRRMGGAGAPDPANPHPEKRVPYLVDGDEHLRERGAIFLYLTDKFPGSGIAPQVGEKGRGAYVTWMSYYQGIMEPVFINTMLGQATPDMIKAYGTFDDMIATLVAALEKGPYLLGESFSAADILCSSPFHWMAHMTPDIPLVQDWVKRCGARPSIAKIAAADMAAMAEMAEA
ncbi:glutathione S-transferase family protein [Donghicola mangrovi]|uniref:Glutathione S-transferase family protein n=1 Tax=Donghicola mangrovi TaxID=2729614 RepID=A0A850Q2W4_9RHOB|nr:glutathione S-transferase family protein [Donghicola mangrovi]NVO23977.1 glutathione S-transferase family protein [Donghicola mangrovi]